MISFTAITIAVAVLIIVMSVMNGFRAHLLDQMLGFAGHAVIEGDILYTPEGRDQTIARVRAVPGVTQAIPITETQTIVQGMGSYTGVIVRGMRGDDLRATPLITRAIKSRLPGELWAAVKTAAMRWLSATAWPPPRRSRSAIN